jgi:hypothetical protein
MIDERPRHYLGRSARGATAPIHRLSRSARGATAPIHRLSRSARGATAPIHRLSGSARKGAAALLPLAGLVLLAGCGGGSSSSSEGTSSAAVTDSATVQKARAVPPVPRPAGAGKVVISSTGPVKARAQTGAIDDEVNASGAKTLNPCTLVSRTQARAILGKPVGEPVDAQQGPTCIYRAQGDKSFVTVAVQAMHFSTVKPQAQLQDRITLSIAGYQAYCGVAGTPTLIVPLSAGRFLSVVAPCPIAASFAAKALGRIS